jgi:hypothetical protein
VTETVAARAHTATTTTFMSQLASAGLAQTLERSCTTNAAEQEQNVFRLMKFPDSIIRLAIFEISNLEAALGRTRRTMPPHDDDGPSSQSSQSIEARFAHLLKPIRDLAENWDVDVASELEGMCVCVGRRFGVCVRRKKWNALCVCGGGGLVPARRGWVGSFTMAERKDTTH